MRMRSGWSPCASGCSSEATELYTSTLTLGEVLVKAVERADETLRATYERVFTV